jgi:hypothetical protein
VGSAERDEIRMNTAAGLVRNYMRGNDRRLVKEKLSYRVTTGYEHEP